MIIYNKYSLCPNSFLFFLCHNSNFLTPTIKHLLQLLSLKNMHGWDLEVLQSPSLEQGREFNQSDDNREEQLKGCEAVGEPEKLFRKVFLFLCWSTTALRLFTWVWSSLKIWFLACREVLQNVKSLRAVTLKVSSAEVLPAICSQERN